MQSVSQGASDPRTEKSDHPLVDVESFLRGRANVRRVDDSEVELKEGALPHVAETVVVKRAL